MSNKDKKLLRLMKTPAKVLTKARDLYIHSLIGCAGQVSYGTVMGCPTGQFSTVSRSRSLSSSRSATQYFSTKEPMRSVSFKGLHQNSDQAEIKPSTQQQQQHQQQQQQQQQQQTGSSTAMANAVTLRNSMPRSFSLGVIGRIDEDKPYCEFEEDDLPVAADVLLRSSSCCFKMNWM